MSASQEFKAQEYLGGSSKLSNLPAVPALWTNKDWKPFQAEQIEDLNSWANVWQLLQEFGPISEDNLPLPCMPANQPTYIRSLSAKTSRSPFNRRRKNDQLGGLAGYYDGILYPTVSLEEPGKGYFNLTGHFLMDLMLILVLAGRRFDIILSDSARSKSSSVVSFLALRPTSLFADLRLSPDRVSHFFLVLANIPAFASSCIIIAYRFAAMLNFILASLEYPLYY
ncbi:hypothetical protein B0H13DRAFT_2265673 [Mycena leptocephala]|nr:hypothetical protein B0H13DRAFT_2265673 [Mycena leptocephala]